jgi:hypothetical protein
MVGAANLDRCTYLLRNQSQSCSESHTDSDWSPPTIADLYNPERKHLHANMNAVREREKITMLTAKAS